MSLMLGAKPNILGVRLFLLATLLVVVSLLAYIVDMIRIATAEVLVGLVVVLTVALWLMIRLAKQDTNHIMTEEPGKAAEAPKKPDEILPPAAAREWLDDFLVKQQDDLSAPL